MYICSSIRTIVMPIAREFDPEIVLVSAGFDGSVGHSSKLGGYEISPACKLEKKILIS